jgi:hypothetical protein
MEDASLSGTRVYTVDGDLILFALKFPSLGRISILIGFRIACVLRVRFARLLASYFARRRFLFLVDIFARSRQTGLLNTVTRAPSCLKNAQALC